MTARVARVVVAGGGMSGLTAAVAAAQAGAEVTVLEKGPTPGGTTLLSGGLVWTWMDAAEMQQAIPHGNAVLQEQLIESLPAGRRWLADLGVTFGAEESVFVYGWGARMDPPLAINLLAKKLLDLGGTISCETALDALRTRAGRVVGVSAADGYGALHGIDADAVVLATGGFHGNPELIRRYVVEPSHLNVRASSWSTGDGLLAGVTAGAAVTPGIDTFYGHALAAAPARYRPLEFRDASQIYGMKAVALNLRGERFTDESSGTGEEELNQELARQPEGRGFYVIDQAVAQEESRPGRRPPRVIIDWGRQRGAPVVQADTLAELAAGLGDHGLPTAVVLNTLESYNRACLDGVAGSLSPARRLTAQPLLQPPFLAMGVKAAITFTMGGLAIDDQARVQRRSMSSSPMAQSITELSEFREVPIPGLYAAGCDTGNISNRGYAGGLSAAIVTGLLAGRNAARGTSA